MNPTSIASPGVVFLAMLLSGCGQGDVTSQAAAPRPAVTVARATSAEIKPATMFTGRVEAPEKVELRARIDGFIEKRLFVEGSDVKVGDLLFTIDSAPYQAAADRAKAELAKAEAALGLSGVELDRQKELVARNASAQARLDEANAKYGQARGEMAAQKAALEKAQLDLGYASIVAPIAGRISRPTYTVGNLVGPSSGALATIVSQDPIYVTFPVTQREILDVRKQEAGKTDPKYAVHLQLADGTRYAKTGELNYLDVTVNRGTDTVLVRAVFSNPDRLLVDGQLVSVIVEGETAESALMVPQQALQIDQAGSYLLVVDKDDKVQVRRIETGALNGTSIAVSKGLVAGERVIVDGAQKVHPGELVQATDVQAGG